MYFAFSPVCKNTFVNVRETIPSESCCPSQVWTRVSSGLTSSTRGRRRPTACWGLQCSWLTRSATKTVRSLLSPALSAALTTSTTASSKELWVEVNTNTALVTTHSLYYTSAVFAFETIFNLCSLGRRTSCGVRNVHCVCSTNTKSPPEIRIKTEIKKRR